ncbi:MAG: TrmH family RNA methyltransferase [Cellulosilyticaceae bacterium]
MENKFISSSQNPIIKNIIQLQKKRSERRKQGLFVVEGIKQVNEIPDHYPVEYYITTEDYDSNQITNLAKGKWIVVPQELFKQMSDTETPQGVMAVVKKQELTLADVPKKDRPFYLVLENLQDPGNLGTIIRSAYGFDVDAILITKGSVDLYSPKTLRSTMSALFHVPIVAEVEMSECIDWIGAQGVTLYATALEESKVLYDVDYTEGCALVIGNEANGVTESTKEIAHQKVRIPMPGGLESLNASIAASICMYEVMKQRTAK